MKRGKAKSRKSAKKSSKKVSKKAVKRSSLKKIEVKTIERISTGVPNFDKLVIGGFKKNSTNLLVGGSGSGKTIFATQFLLEGMRNGESCLYVTFEEKKDEFYDNMRGLGWDLEEYEKKGQFVFLEYAPLKVKTMLEEGGGSIESIINKNKISRIVIDSITSFALLFEDELSQREAALALFNMINKWSCTSLLTVEREPSITEEREVSGLEFEADSIILLYYIRDEDQRERYLEVLKMRGTDHSKKIHAFVIDNKGIQVEDKTYTSAHLINLSKEKR